MSLWVDKYRPRSLGDLDYHKEQAVQLKNLVQGGDFPHLLVHGPPGSGKKTRIMCLLRELYGPGVDKLRIQRHTVVAPPSNKRVEINAVASNYHLEVNASDAGNQDRAVVQELIRTVAAGSRQFQSVGFKVVLLSEADRLSDGAQHALRCTMEKHASTCRLVLCCRSASGVIAPVRSRCLTVRVASPAAEEVCAVLSAVCEKEGLPRLPPELARRICDRSGRNLRRALLACEASCRTTPGPPLSAGQEVPETDWEAYLRETAGAILGQQSPQRLLEVRGRLYELLVHGVPPEVIVKGLLAGLLQGICNDGRLKMELVHAAAYYEHSLRLGSKAIYHLEAFVAKFMATYKGFPEDGVDAVMF